MIKSISKEFTTKESTSYVEKLNMESVDIAFDNGLSIMCLDRQLKIYDDNGDLICKVNVQTKDHKNIYKIEV
jgi:hypothetical protein